MHSKRIDLVSQYLIYRGEAPVNTGEASAAWRIRRILIDINGIETVSFAANSVCFSQIWKNRHSLTYGDE